MCFDTCLKIVGTCQNTTAATATCATLANRTHVLPQSSPLCGTVPPATAVNVDAVSVGVDTTVPAGARASSSSKFPDNIDWTSAAVGAGSVLAVGAVCAAVAVGVSRARSRVPRRGRGAKLTSTPGGRDVVVTESPTYLTTVVPRARVRVEMTGIVPNGPLPTSGRGASPRDSAVHSPSRSLGAAPSTGV